MGEPRDDGEARAELRRDEAEGRRNAALLALLMFAICFFCIYRMIAVWPAPGQQGAAAHEAGAPPASASAPRPRR